MGEEQPPSNDELRDGLETGLLRADLSDFSSISGDALELGIDVLLQDGILKDVPIVGTVAKLHSATCKLYTYRVQKNILYFFQEYSKGNIEESTRQQFITKLQENPKYRTRVLDIVLVSLAQFNDAIQAKVLANLIIAHINGHTDFNQLRACEFALERLNPIAYEYLDQLSRNDTPYTTHRENPDQEALLYSAGIASRYGTILRVSQVGKDLFIYGIQPLNSQR